MLQVPVDSLPQGKSESFVWMTVPRAKEAVGDRVAPDAGDLCAPQGEAELMLGSLCSPHSCGMGSSLHAPSCPGLRFPLLSTAVWFKGLMGNPVEHGPSRRQ